MRLDSWMGTQALKYRSQESNVNESDAVSDNDKNVVKVTGNPLQMCLVVKLLKHISEVTLNLEFSGLETGRSINPCVFYALK